MQHYAAFHLGLHCLHKYSFIGFPNTKGYVYIKGSCEHICCRYSKEPSQIGRRVATVREKVLENEKCSRSGKSQGISFSVREI